MNQKQNPLIGESFWGWFLKILSGLAIIMFLTLHFVVNHLVAPGGLLTFEDVLKYYSKPVIPIIEILFLFTVVPHSLLGLRGILLDLNPSPNILKFITYVMIVCGIFTVSYGIWLIIEVITI